MQTINFKQFGFYTDIERTKRIESDIRKDFANVIYTNASGIVAHDLAFRIYRSDGPIEVNDDEIAVIKSLYRGMTVPFIEAMNEQLGETATADKDKD